MVSLHVKQPAAWAVGDDSHEGVDDRDADRCASCATPRGGTAELPAERLTTEMQRRSEDDGGW